MNLKAIMFAGLGLGVSVGLTSWWVGSDMAEIRERQKAKAERCEQLRAQAGGGAATGSQIDPVTGQAIVTDPGLGGSAPATGATTPTDPAIAAELAKCPKPVPGTGGAVPGNDEFLVTDQAAAGATDPSLGGNVDPNAAGAADPALQGSGFSQDAAAGVQAQQDAFLAAEAAAAQDAAAGSTLTPAPDPALGY